MRRFLSIAVVSLGLGACGGGGGASSSMPGAQSPERQSEGEYDLAREAFYKGEPREALAHVRKAIELDDENAKALYFASAIHLSFCVQSTETVDCRLGDAESYARRSMKADEHFHDARNLLGQVLILMKRYREAASILEPLTRDMAYSANHLAWGNLGWAQVLGGDLDHGISSLENSITQPKFCVGHYRLGIAYEKKGDLHQADAAFTHAVTVDAPECRELQEAWEARGRVRAHLGRQDDARNDFQRCREIARETPTGRACARQLGQAPQAIGMIP